MTGARRNLVIRRVLVPAATLAAVITGWVSLATTGALAGTGITITSGGCAGGGSAFCYSPEAAGASVGSAVTGRTRAALRTPSRRAHRARVPERLRTVEATPSTSPRVPAMEARARSPSPAQERTSTSTIHGYALMHGSITVAAAPTSPSPSASAPGPSPTPPPTATPAPAGSGPSAPHTGGAPGPLGGRARHARRDRPAGCAGRAAPLTSRHTVRLNRAPLGQCSGAVAVLASAPHSSVRHAVRSNRSFARTSGASAARREISSWHARSSLRSSSSGSPPRLRPTAAVRTPSRR